MWFWSHFRDGCFSLVSTYQVLVDLNLFSKDPIANESYPPFCLEELGSL